MKKKFSYNKLLKFLAMFALTGMLLFVFATLVSIIPREGVDGYSKEEKQVCREADADYTLFSHGCGDTCNTTGEQYRTCTEAMDYACDCGERKCWDGNECILE